MNTFLTVPDASRRAVAVARPQGFALIATLALIVLLTFIMVLFFTRATSNRQIESAEIGSQKADLLARGALQAVVRDIRQEMVAGSTNYVSSGVSIFQPVTNTAAIPYRALAPGISSTDTNFYSLAKESGTSPMFPSSAPYTNNSAAAMILGSTNTTDEPSANGRTVSAARWNAPYLTANGFSSSSQLPTWVLLTRAGIAPSQTWNSQFGNSAQSNPNYVVGRFAYTIYDESGLLDINAAGYPSSLSQAQIASLKGTLMGADLSQIPGIADPNSLIQWRNAASALSPSSFTNAAAWQVTNGAFLVPYTGDNQYLSRQDLIRYAQANPSVISTNALQYLTTFTREVNAPIWGPDRNASDMGGNNGQLAYYANGYQWAPNMFTNSTLNTQPSPYGYVINADTYGQYNRNILNIRFTTSGTVTNYAPSGTLYTNTVSVGDLLVQHRFSLDKLSWIGPSGPVKPANCPLTDAQFNNAIQACFGLVWDSNNNVWDYVGPTGSVVQKVIEPLDDVGTGNLNYPENGGSYVYNDSTPRSPNFFELLKAGILSGSLGLWLNNNGNVGSWNDGTCQYWNFNSSPDVQVMRIGACLIDQCSSATNPPTCILFHGLPVVGSKSLPLINKLTFTSEKHQTAPNQYDNSASVWLEFEMWNPYADAKTVTLPSKFQIIVGGSTSSPIQTTNYLTGTAQVSLGVTSNTNALNVDSNHNLYLNDGLLSGQALQVTIPGGVQMDEPTMIAQLGAGNCTSVNNPNPQTPGYFEDDVWPGDANNPGPIVGFNIGYYDGSPQSNTADSEQIDFTPHYLTAFQSMYNTNDTKNSAIGGLDVNYYLQYYYGGLGWRTVQVLHNVLLQYNYFNIYYPADGTKRQGAIAMTDPRSDRFGSSTLYIGNSWAWTADGQQNPGTFWGTNLMVDPQAPSTQLVGTQAILNGSVFVPYSGIGYQTPLAFFRYADNTGQATTKSSSCITDPYYLDMDGVQRAGDGVWSSGNSASGVYPLARPSVTGHVGASANQYPTDRPVILNRPFQSVGEMSYAFRDTPWRSLDFTSSNNADDALMDFFCVGDDSQSLRAGRINPNRASQATLAALMSGANQDVLNGTYVSAANAQTAATAIWSTLQTTPAKMKSQLLQNVPTSTLTTSISPIKSQRDAVVRSLAEVSQTRTWNLMVDVVAQSGRYSSTATGADQFTVDGERRYWLHLAIDRYTGKIVDQQLELVNE